jgi:hypothetical protein
VLAEYVIALLKHEGDDAAVRALCEQEMLDFLPEGKAFAYTVPNWLLQTR